MAKSAILLPSPSPAVPAAGEIDTFIRSALFLAAMLLLWITIRPFGSLAEAPEVSDAGNFVNQIAYSLLFLLLAAWCILHDPIRLALLVRPIFVGALLWCALSVVTSWEPELSARRFAFGLVSIGIAAMVLLLPRSVRHFGDLIAAAALIVLALCYLGIFLIPSRAIHQATDFLEPDLAGDWRGIFGHKNEAGATMVLFVFIGLFVARMRNAGLGALIVALSVIFLVFTRSKTSIMVLPLVLVTSYMMGRIRRPFIGIGLALSLVFMLSLLSVGSIYFEPVRDLLDAIMSDSTFTGRTDIWQFVVDTLMQRPITGFGFATFWGTEEVVYGMSGGASWANTAGHAHNGFLDLALTIGIPGSVLFSLWIFVMPLFDYYRGARDPSNAPLSMLFLQVCLFGIFVSCFESMFVMVGELWMFLITATFGLRLLALTRAIE